jgi:membrane fusion protein (multidrug efflux system)
MLRKTLLVLAIASALAACGNKDAKDGKPAASGSASAAASASGAASGTAKSSAPPVTLAVAPEDLLVLASNNLASGPVVTGSVQPERKADLRAEISAVVLQVLKENGEAVKRGDVLVRLDDTAIRDSVNSAEEAERAAARSLDQAERQMQRAKTLRESGMTSVAAMDDAEVRRNNAQSDVLAAKTRTAQARQQLQRTLVRAPFDGVVSDRKVSAGDTASVGKEMLKVIDPSSMRFEGRVSTDKISMVKVGQPVSFRVNGFANQEFRGVVKRVDPSANDITRQVEVLVSLTGSNQPRVAGLYAEGRVEAENTAALMLPEAALLHQGDKNYAWKVKDKQLVRTDLVVGARDPRTGFLEIKQGLAAGDVVMRNSSSSFKDGQKVDLGAAKVASATAPAPAVQGK